MSEGKKSYNLAAIVLFSVLFGGASGIIVDLAYRNYFDQNASSMFGEINVSNGNFNGSKLEITQPKNVVVQQNDKVDETVNSSIPSLVGIFKKNSAMKTQARADGLSFDFYKVGQESAQGLILTSDGWIVTNQKLDNMSDYVVVTSDKKVYEITKFFEDKSEPFYYLRVDVKDFPVKKFAVPGDVSNGQLVLAVNWSGSCVLTSVNNANEETSGLVRSSDSFFSDISTLQSVNGSLALFDLAGDIAGLIDKTGKIIPMNNLEAALAGLLSAETPTRPSLGLNYLDISELVVNKPANALPTDRGALVFKDDKGVAIIPASAALAAGFKEGDIILSIENFNIDTENNLTDILQNFRPGETVNIVYMRNGEKKNVDVKLGEIK